MRTPAEMGYRMPAEWHPHEATWLAFPHNRETWPTQLEAVEETYLQMMAALLPGEDVRLLVTDERMTARARRRLKERGVDTSRLHCHVVPTVDAWIRDYGPNFLLSESGPAFNNWTFNAWGGKYADLALDDCIPGRLAPLLEMPSFSPGIVLEGGSIEVNGAGLCMTTEQCLLHPNRNPHLSRGEIEAALKSYLGVEKVLWLGEGLEGDDTDGHIDDIARFVDASTVVCVREEDPSDANHALLEDNWKRLQAARDVAGRPLKLVALPSPGRIESDGERLPASYANFYIANRVVLAPTFQHPNDSKALETLQRLFPRRRVVGIDCRDLVYGLGAIHCVTHQQPRGGGFEQRRHKGQEFEIERTEASDYRLVRRSQPASRGLTRWLLECQVRGYFVPVESESTDTL